MNLETANLTLTMYSGVTPEILKARARIIERLYKVVEPSEQTNGPAPEIPTRNLLRLTSEPEPKDADKLDVSSDEDSKGINEVRNNAVAF